MIDKNKVSLNIKNNKVEEKSKGKTKYFWDYWKKKKDDKNEHKEFGIKEEELVKINNAENKNNGLRETTILELLESKLTEIFFDQNPLISSKDINDLKKISGAIIKKDVDLQK